MECYADVAITIGTIAQPLLNSVDKKYYKQIDDELDALWESGQFDEKRMKKLRGSHFHTPYNK